MAAPLPIMTRLAKGFDPAEPRDAEGRWRKVKFTDPMHSAWDPKIREVPSERSFQGKRFEVSGFDDTVGHVFEHKEERAKHLPSGVRYDIKHVRKYGWEPTSGGHDLSYFATHGFGSKKAAVAALLTHLNSQNME